MKKYIVLFIMLVSFCGCSALKLPTLVTPKKPETVYNWEEKITNKPKAVICDGKVVVVEETEKTLTVGLEQTTPKLSFAQKLGNWISGLSIIGILALIAGLILAPGATLAWLVKLLFKWKKAFKETVVAIKESKAVDNNPELKNTLASKQSLSTKKIVDNIKREI